MRRLRARLLENRESGQALVIAIVLLVAMELLGFALTTLSEVDASTAANLVKNEEALYASEQGVVAGINWTLNRTNKIAVEETQPLNSISYRGKYYNKYITGAEPEPFPRWSVLITNLGRISGGLGENLLAYRYRVESVGIGGTRAGGMRRGLVREQRMEYGLIDFSPYDIVGGDLLYR